MKMIIKKAWMLKSGEFTALFSRCFKAQNGHDIHQASANSLNSLKVEYIIPFAFFSFFCWSLCVHKTHSSPVPIYEAIQLNEFYAGIKHTTLVVI